MENKDDSTFYNFFQEIKDDSDIRDMYHKVLEKRNLDSLRMFKIYLNDYLTRQASSKILEYIPSKLEKNDDFLEAEIKIKNIPDIFKKKVLESFLNKEKVENIDILLHHIPIEFYLENEKKIDLFPQSLELYKELFKNRRIGVKYMEYLLNKENLKDDRKEFLKIACLNPSLPLSFFKKYNIVPNYDILESTKNELFENIFFKE
jgi:hypothetical protein